MERHYFIGEGPEAKALIAEANERWRASCDARKRLLEDYGADFFMETSYSLERGGRIEGLGFSERVKRPYFKGEERTKMGYAYYPKLSTREGKALAKRLEEEKELHFCTAVYLLKKLNISRILFEGGRVHWCTAGWIEDKVLLSVPGPKSPKDLEERKKLNLSIDPWPQIPDWFREVKQSEFLAAQGE